MNQRNHGSTGSRGIFANTAVSGRSGDTWQQPIYSDLISQFNIQRARKAKDLENRYKMYIRANGSLDPELQENLDFYRNL